MCDNKLTWLQVKFRRRYSPFSNVSTKSTDLDRITMYLIFFTENWRHEACECAKYKCRLLTQRVYIRTYNSPISYQMFLHHPRIDFPLLRNQENFLEPRLAPSDYVDCKQTTEHHSSAWNVIWHCVKTKSNCFAHDQIRFSAAQSWCIGMVRVLILAHGLIFAATTCHTPLAPVTKGLIPEHGSVGRFLPWYNVAAPDV